MNSTPPADFSFEPLTPTAFLRRAARVYGDRVGVIDGDRRFTYADFLQRCLKFAGALKQLGVAPGDRVAILAGNSHVMLAAHYAVPFAGAALVALNTRITPADTAYILEHSGSSLLICDSEFMPAAEQAAAAVHARLRVVCAGGLGDELEALIDAAAAFSVPVDDERGAARHQLHQRHDGASEGGDVPPPRRLPAVARDGAAHGRRSRLGVPLDPADVPLQRLVLQLGGDRGRRRPSVPAAARAEPDLAAHAQVGRDPLLRRADGADDDHLGPAGRQARRVRCGSAPAARRRHRRCSSASPSSAWTSPTCTA